MTTRRLVSVTYCRRMKDAERFRQDRKSVSSDGTRVRTHISRRMLSAYYCGDGSCHVDNKQDVDIQLRMRQQRLRHRRRRCLFDSLVHKYSYSSAQCKTNQFLFDHPRFSSKFGKRPFKYLTRKTWNRLSVTYLYSHVHPRHTGAAT